MSVRAFVVANAGPEVRSYPTRHPGVGEDLIELFAATPRMHEVARAPGDGFCGVRVGVNPAGD